MTDSPYSCLRCLGEAQLKDWYQICREFKPVMKKHREARVKFLLMELAFRPRLKPSQSDLMLTAAASARSAPPELVESGARSLLPMLRLKYKTSKEAPSGGRSLPSKFGKSGENESNGVHLKPKHSSQISVQVNIVGFSAAKGTIEPNARSGTINLVTATRYHLSTNYLGGLEAARNLLCLSELVSPSVQEWSSLAPLPCSLAASAGQPVVLKLPTS